MICAPFTPDQVKSLNEFQQNGYWHLFTCGNDSLHKDLRATEQGWVCDDCNYTQNWAHNFMADWTWKKLRTGF